MKVVNPSNPVTSEWLAEQGFRLDPSPYLSGAVEARQLLQRLPNTVPLCQLTTGHNGGIFNGPKFGRTYLTDDAHSVPFLGSTDMLELDFSFLPRISTKISSKLSYLEVVPGMTLISCSGTIGRMAYVRPDMKGFWSSQHIMKIEPHKDRIPPGYLYTFLRSRFGVPMITSAAYGAIIQHIEPHHIADLPVPRLDVRLETQIHELIDECAQLRTEFQAGLAAATEDFFNSVGLPELVDLRWHNRERDIGFEVTGLTSSTLRALNFAPRARWIAEKLASVRHKSLGRICSGGQLSRGVRFKRIDSDPKHGEQLVGQRQAFWARPEGRWIATSEIRGEVFAKDESILVASQGTLGENEVYGRSILVMGAWKRFAFSEHFLRIVSSDPEVSGAYLFAFFRSEAAFRLLRSMSTGGKQQDIHETLRAEIPIPIAPPADRERIAETVRQAYRDRDRADELEDKALDLLTTAIEGAAA